MECVHGHVSRIIKSLDRVHECTSYESWSATVTVHKELLKLIDDNNINTVIIPANCTDRLQPLDLSVNKAVKNFLRKQFQEWYAQEVFSQLEEERDELIDLRLSTVKPLGAQWMTDMFDYFKSDSGVDIIKNGFKSAGIMK